MKKILIALDYDETAQQVAETGYDITRSMHGKAILLHVIADTTEYSYLDYSPIMGFGGFSHINLAESDSVEALQRAALDYLGKTKSHLKDETIQTVVKTGNFGEAILATAKEVSADIIVVGTHSRRGLEKILLGSVAENVLHQSTVPVLIIPVKKTDTKK